DGAIYSLEGPLVDVDSSETMLAGAAESRRAIVRRSLNNQLAAYDAATGKLKWRCVPEASAPVSDQERGFLSAPVAVRGRLLAPVSHEGELWLYALDPASGEIDWRVFLCDEPPGGCSPWAAVALAADAGELYLAAGAGIVFAIDGSSGRVEWAVAYRRNGIRDMQAGRPGAGFVVKPDVDGWQRDAVLIHGPQLIVTPSDYGYVVALDRRDGRLLWHSPRQPSIDEPPAEVCLGIAGDGLFVAGRNIVRRYDLPSGRLAWQTTTESSHGRGLLTRNAVFVPAESSILRLDLKTGVELSRSELITASREPVGNLYSDGRRLLCLSGERLYSLAGLEPHLDGLAARIAAGDADAQLERMRLNLRLSQPDEAVADLRAACRLVAEQRGHAASRRMLFDGLGELNLPATRPRLTLELIATAASRNDETQFAANGAGEDAVWRRSQLLNAALRRIADETAAETESRLMPRESTVQAILDAAPFCREPFLQAAARRAIATAATAATADDRDALSAAANAEDPAVRLLAVTGLAAVATDEELPLLRAALGDPHEPVRFEAAAALVNRGERDALSAFAELLESDDVHIRNRSLATLRAVTGQHFGYVASAAADERAAKAAEWRTWIGEYGATAELRLPIRESGLTLGRTLISYTNNRVVELDDRGRIVWQQEVANPRDCQGLPNGHRLIASYSGRAVLEYDAGGRLVWQKADLPSSPYSVERLDNGNTLVACSSANKLLELAGDGSVVHETPLPDQPRDATRLANGHTLVALYMTQRVAEVDRDGTILWEVGEMNRPVSVQRLDNGNTLVCQFSGKQVVEIDRARNVVWFKSGLEYPYDAQRLPSGNTLIVDREGVQEVDAAGRVVWQQPGSGATSVCRY
ncbi:MAG TPA: PQQ-binding-like beta-propeller repeat protein, partial [Planctomycetaceae bacterium]|nr:PQQ-binding-like beta-propeller repeat protein [Planctomycetaceae bacterium]